MAPRRQSPKPLPGNQIASSPYDHCSGSPASKAAPQPLGLVFALPARRGRLAGVVSRSAAATAARTRPREVLFQFANQAVEPRACVIVEPGRRQPAASCEPVFQFATVDTSHPNSSVVLAPSQRALGNERWNWTMVQSHGANGDVRLALATWHHVCSGIVDARTTRFGRAKTRQDEDRRDTPAKFPAKFPERDGAN